MARLRLPLLAHCGLSAWAIHIMPGSEESPDFSAEQRLDELAAIQAAAIPGLFPEAELLAGSGSRRGHREPRTFWGCDTHPFWMAMPAHTATCTVGTALSLTLSDAGIPCRKNAGQDHDHEGLVGKHINRVGWTQFNSTISVVMAKDPWSRVVSAASWLKGFNASSEPEEQIRDFREFLSDRLPTKDMGPMYAVPSGMHKLRYLHSISEFAYAELFGRGYEEQVVTYVGRVKELSKSVKHICELLGLQAYCVDPNDPRVKSHRVTGEKRVRTVDLFNDELRGRVADVWAKDIERFGFEFGEL
jgi:hypothetical protein